MHNICSRLLFVLVFQVFFLNVALSHTKIRVLELDRVPKKIPNSLYNKITIVDSRRDTIHYGFVSAGRFWEKYEAVVLDTPLSIQLSNFFRATIDSSAQNGEILIQIRRFYFTTSTIQGIFLLNATAYAVAPEGYRKISAIDTIIITNINYLLPYKTETGTRWLLSFIQGCLTQRPDSTYARPLSCIVRIDSFEKRQIKVYNTDRYQDGLYLCYTSFASQEPDLAGEVITKDSVISEVRVINNKGKMAAIKPKQIYALVHNGKPYKATHNGYYPIRKENDDFYYNGTAELIDFESYMSYEILFSSVGRGPYLPTASSGRYLTGSTFKIALDHRRGSYLFIKELTRPRPRPY